MWEKIEQIWKAKDLRKNILFVLAMLLLFRLAAHIPIPGVNAMAQSFTRSPGFTKLAAFRPGAIAVFWRGALTNDTGHVGFAVSEDATRVQVLGGNENDQVMIEPINKAGSTMGLLGYWWPVATSTTCPTARCRTCGATSATSSRTTSCC